MKIWASIPAAAAKATIAPPAFPADGIATFLTPSPTHIDTAQESPRALKLPVGLTPSSFTHRSSLPRRAPRRVVWTRGVMPSPSEIIAEGFDRGRRGAY